MYVLSKIRKISQIFNLKFILFTAVKNCKILHGRVCEMCKKQIMRFSHLNGIPVTKLTIRCDKVYLLNFLSIHNKYMHILNINQSNGQGEYLHGYD